MVTTAQFNRLGTTGFAAWAIASETDTKLVFSRNTLSSTEEQVKINQMLIGLSVLPLLTGVATAAQPTSLSDTQMDKVTAGALPAGFVTTTLQISNLGPGSLETPGGPVISTSIHITYAIFSDCDLCNAALSAFAPPP